MKFLTGNKSIIKMNQKETKKIFEQIVFNNTMISLKAILFLSFLFTLLTTILAAPNDVPPSSPSSTSSSSSSFTTTSSSSSSPSRPVGSTTSITVTSTPVPPVNKVSTSSTSLGSLPSSNPVKRPQQQHQPLPHSQHAHLQHSSIHSHHQQHQNSHQRQHHSRQPLPPPPNHHQHQHQYQHQHQHQYQYQQYQQPQQHYSYDNPHHHLSSSSFSFHSHHQGANSEQLPYYLSQNECRPDYAYVNGKCVRLRMSLSDLVRDLLENSENSSSLVHFQFNEPNTTTITTTVSPVNDSTVSSIGSERVPVSDLFIQNLAVISEANMSNCLALAACNEHCWSWPERTVKQRQYEEMVVDRHLQSILPILGSSTTSQQFDPLTEPLLSKGKDDNNRSDKVGATVDIGEGDDASSSGTDFVRIIMSASKKGLEFGRKGVVIVQSQPPPPLMLNASGSGLSNTTTKSKATTTTTTTSRWNSTTCLACFREFSECNAMQYEYVTRINAIYRRMVEANATLYDKVPEAIKHLSPEVLYYHYSMRFLDLANLTTCYAMVSCENSCAVYKSALADNGIHTISMLQPPPNVSPFMKDDIVKPKAIDTIHSGAVLGYRLALEQTDDCEKCAHHYTDCTANSYEIARASSNIFG